MKRVIIAIASITVLATAGTRAKDSNVNDAPSRTVTKTYSETPVVKEAKTGGTKDRTITKASAEKIAEKKARKNKKGKGKHKNKKGGTKHPKKSSATK